MATLAISAVGNLAIGIGLSLLFGPDDQVNEGPRLGDRNFTSAAYGTPVSITFGTDRVTGVIIDTQDPVIEEVVLEETTGGKGGPSVTNRTFKYFLTADIAFGIEGAKDLIRLIGNRAKLIVDNDGTSGLSSGTVQNPLGTLGNVEGASVLFYPGGPTQEQDPEESSRRGSDVPAYRHLTRVKVNRLPLLNLNNNVPNFEAIIAYESEVSTPFIALDEPAGLDPPGSPTGADTTFMLVDPFRSIVYSLKNSSTGLWSATLGGLEFAQFIGGGGLSQPTVGLDGFAYTQTGGTNAATLLKIDTDTGETVGQVGQSGLGLVDDADSFGNNGSWYQLQNPASQDLLVDATIPGLTPVLSMVMHMNSSVVPNGSLVLSTNVSASIGGGSQGVQLEIIKTLSAADGFESMDGFTIPDHDRGVFYTVVSADSGATFQIIRISFGFGQSSGGIFIPQFDELRRFTRGDPGDDFPDSGGVTGWAVDRATGRLIISTDGSMLLYDPDTDQILAQRSDLGMVNHNNYYNGSTFAFPRTSTLNGDIFVLDTRTLETTRTIDVNTIGWPGGGTVAHDPSAVWDDLTQAIVLSRVELGSTAPVDGRILKIYVNRVEGLGVGLDFVCEKISTIYNRFPMAGLQTSDIDVTELAGDTVPGYTLSAARSTARAALQPLRARHFFDAVQSDWIMKFLKRNRASIFTIPEDDMGKRVGSDERKPPVVESRTPDRELPMRVTLRYKNKDIQYNPDAEHDKRQRKPVATMSSTAERVINLAMVDQPTPIKKTASKHLFDAWAERVKFESTIPWRYIKLDPADVYSIVVSDDTFRVRAQEIDFNASMAIGFKSVVEDEKNASSNANAGDAKGFVKQFINTPLPTRFVPFDAPILNVADFKFASVSNAYVALGAYEDGWPGGSVYRSSDDADYLPAGGTLVEAALAKVKVVPGPWDGQDNRFQEVSEGGSMTLSILRRGDVWQSATELQVLNGGNTLGVITDNGVEIIQYQDVTVNDDNTVLLERLLRGRLGTEDITDAGGPGLSDGVVFLSAPDGTQETQPIVRTNQNAALLNAFLYYRGVTLGTLIEDALTEPFQFTGRDLKPYSPSQIDFADNGDATNTISWLRRTRGPNTGEWIDGTGLVPLNETIERFDVEIEEDSSGTIVFNETVDDQEFIDIDEDTAESIFYQGPNVLVNGDFETGVLTPWVAESGTGTWSVQTLPIGNLTNPDPNFPAGLSRVLNYNDTVGTDTQYRARQEIDLTVTISDFTDIDKGLASTKLSVSLAQAGGGQRNLFKTRVDFLDGSGTLISSFEDPNLHNPSTNVWKRVSISAPLPSGTRRIQYKVVGQRSGTGLDENGNPVFSSATVSEAAYDNAVALLTDPSNTYTIRVFQVSEFIGRGIPGSIIIP